MYIFTFLVIYLTWHLSGQMHNSQSVFVYVAHVPNEYNISNLRHFIHRGMVDCSSLIWIDRNLYHSFFMARLTVPAQYGTSVNEAEYFCITQYLYGSTHKFIVFHTFISTWTTIPNCRVCCNSVFRLGSSCMDFRTVFYVTVGLAQALPNNNIWVSLVF